MTSQMAALAKVLLFKLALLPLRQAMPAAAVSGNAESLAGASAPPF